MRSRPVSASTAQARDAAVRAFVHRNYGLAGTLRLHRAALGLDLVRAPLNVALALVFLSIQLGALLAAVARCPRLARWLSSRRVLLPTNVSAELERRLAAFLAELDRRGLGPGAPPETVARAVQNYAAVRNAVAEITTSLIVLATGIAIFDVATPGVVSLTGPIAEQIAQRTAVAGFPLGERLGGVWYGMFPAHLPFWELLLIGVAIAAIASLVTTFAGLIADPVQVVTGIHRRRLARLLRRLDAASDGSALAGEHLLARAGDVGDALLGVLRGGGS